MSNMDPDCVSYSYGNDDYYDDDDCYDHDYVNDNINSINSCYQYDDNSVVSSHSYTSASSVQHKSISLDLYSDDNYMRPTSSALQVENTLPNTLDLSPNVRTNLDKKKYHNDIPQSETAFKRVFIVLLKQIIDSHLATFFMSNFGKQHIK